MAHGERIAKAGRADTSFEPDHFTHVARWNHEQEWREIAVRAEGARSVRPGILDLAVGLDDGEERHSEISAEFRRSGLAAEVGAAGLEMTRGWTDPAVDFTVIVGAGVNRQGHVKSVGANVVAEGVHAGR